MSDTPRTDQYVKMRTSLAYCVDRDTSDFARKLERELAEANRIIKECLSVMPVGYIPSHTPENLPAKIQGLVKELAENTTIRHERVAEELAKVTKQRDDLLESLKEVMPYIVGDRCVPWEKAQDAIDRCQCGRGCGMSDTPRTDAFAHECLDGDLNGVMVVDSKFARQLERELDEALEWKRYLSSWGGTPEIVYSFIQGQQARIRAAQEAEKQRDLLIEGLEKLASCDWVITLPDRMDAVREIAKQTLQIVKNNEL